MQYSVTLNYVNTREHTDHLDKPFAFISDVQAWVETNYPAYTSYQVIVVRKSQ